MTFDLRRLIHTSLSEDPQLTEMVGDRVMQRDLMQEPGMELEKPFLVHALGLKTESGPSAARNKAQWIMVWAHQERGDYYTVDQVLDHCKRVLEGIPNQGAFYEIRHLERSEDLFDKELRTNCRYDRYQAVLTE
jgi:hypothetical protein